MGDEEILAFEEEILAKVTEMVIRRFEEAKAYGNTKLEAKYIFKRLADQERRFWEAVEGTRKAWVPYSLRRSFIKKALKALLKKGQLICLPVYSTHRQYRQGKAYRPVRCYEYRWVENALDLLTLATAAKP